MVLLARLWVSLEESRQSNIESVSLSVSILIYITEQAVLLMGQTNSRLSILSSLMNPRQVKSLLKNKTTVLQSQYANLFGKEFRQHLVEKVKAKKQLKEAFIENIPEKYNYMKTRPFRSGPSRESVRDGGRKIVFENIDTAR